MERYKKSGQKPKPVYSSVGYTPSGEPGVHTSLALLPPAAVGRPLPSQVRASQSVRICPVVRMGGRLSFFSGSLGPGAVRAVSTFPRRNEDLVSHCRRNGIIAARLGQFSPGFLALGF